MTWIQYEPMARSNTLFRVLRQSPRPVTQHVLPFLYPARATSQSHAAVAGFRILGPEARPAIPALVQLLNRTNSPYASYRAALALAAIGKEAWPPLIVALGNP
ncbi:MAG TPA: hypothetical protein VNT26_11565, partial [Candidatus Sulfotelmatobacter sp.]|nr:hypothetical protein [Candidatus Sulfotelmatobacter sp.]